MALFTKQSDTASRLYRKTIRDNAVLPIIVQLVDHKWLCIVLAETNLHVSCSGQRQFIQTLLPGINVIDIPVGCSARSPLFEIPKVVGGRTNIKALNRLKDDLFSHRLSPDLWDDLQPDLISQVEPNSKLPDLAKIGGLPITHFHSLIDKAIKNNNFAHLETDGLSTMEVALIISMVLLALAGLGIVGFIAYR